MARRKSLDPTPPPAPPRPLRRWAIQFGVVVLVATALYCGLLMLLDAVRQPPQEPDVLFADLGCVPPPGLSRREFLEEVQYVSGLPDRLAPHHVEQLPAAFAKHPWVRTAPRVSAREPGKWDIKDLQYRQYVLVVAVPVDLGEWRGVDADGVLLPKKAPLIGNPLQLYGAPGPSNAAGKPWGDPTVHAAARAAVWLAGQSPRVPVAWSQWTGDGLVLHGRGFRVQWGVDEGGAAGQRLKAALRDREWLSRWTPWVDEIDLSGDGTRVLRVLRH